MSTPAVTSMVMTRIGGQEYPVRSVPTCKTCQSPHRTEIENGLLQGYSYASIVRSLEDLPPGHLGHPDARSITHHAKTHMPIGPAARRALIERRATEVGRAIEDDVEGLADHVTVSRMIMAKGFERLMRGEIEPDAKDLMAAAKFLADLDRTSPGGLDQETFMEVLHAYMRVAQEFIPQERWAEYGAALSRDPVLRQIKAEQDDQQRAALAAG